MQDKRVVIIGAGPAGCAAAVQCARLGLDPLLVDMSGRSGGLVRNAFCIENHPGLARPISGPEFVRRLESHLARFHVEVMACRCKGWTRDGALFTIQFDSGEEVVAQALIVATGTTARRCGLANEEELEGRFLFYEVADLLEQSPSSVLVVGGGEAAFDYAMSLAGAGCRTSICVRSALHRAGPRLEELALALPLVELSLNTSVLQAVPAGDVISVTLDIAGVARVVSADAILVAVGRQKRWPEVWKELTIAPGLYIAGDARLGALGQAAIAVGDGLHAAMLANEYLQTQEEGC